MVTMIWLQINKTKKALLRAPLAYNEKIYLIKFEINNPYLK